MTSLLFLPSEEAITASYIQRLRKDVPVLDILVAERQDEASVLIKDTEAAYGEIKPNVLAGAHGLRWLQSPWIAPPASFFFPALVEHEVVVTNTRGIFNDHLAFQVMAYVLSFARNLPDYLYNQLESKWEPLPGEEPVVHLPESTMLIVGFGGAGYELARIASAFGMRIIATDARPQEAPAGVEAVFPADHLDQLLPEADFVVLTVPVTPHTKLFFNRDRMRLMKTSAVLINIGRGATLSLTDLEMALMNQEIKGAALDVCEIEPLPQTSKLWSMRNVIITPHVGWHGPYVDDRRYDILRRNALAFLNDEPLINVVDKTLTF